MLQVNTDSRNLIDWVYKLPAWRARDWHTRTGHRVRNEEELQRLDRLLCSTHRLVVQWRHVPTHSNLYGNDKADVLAKLGAGLHQH